MLQSLLVFFAVRHSPSQWGNKSIVPNRQPGDPRVESNRVELNRIETNRINSNWIANACALNGAQLEFIFDHARPVSVCWLSLAASIKPPKPCPPCETVPWCHHGLARAYPNYKYFLIYQYIPTRFLRRLLRRLHAIRYVPQNVFGETPRGTGVPGDGAFWPSPVSSADAENTSPGKCKCSRQAGSLSGMNAQSMKGITYNGIVKGVFHISGRSETISGTQGIHTLSDNRQQRMQKKRNPDGPSGKRVQRFYYIIFSGGRS